MTTPRMLHIKAAPGAPPLRDHVFPHPFLPEEGAVVAEHPYWWRKLARGAAVLVVPEPVPAGGTTRESDTIAGEDRAPRKRRAQEE